ncbi:hypothetical protein FB45DRAFT_867742 [Roridomyces roridus]|uniref:Uncharacterized protein n=1 Tax=Roridomyces roridus TaxID=1738132 RepID=A0AAD7FMW1_9AGAR|nr:hypothetical protein FB45DRAFT_867742 [Roridomyces roridus]
MATNTLTVAVCISNEVVLSDFVQPIEILANINETHNPLTGDPVDVPFQVVFDYLPRPDTRPDRFHRRLRLSHIQSDQDVCRGHGHAVRHPVGPRWPTAALCHPDGPGAIQLAIAGLLPGKRATTNKAFYNLITEAPGNAKDIKWVPKARWVVDGNVWTSSGVSAVFKGLRIKNSTLMALAFLEHLAGAKLARQVRNIVEIPEVSSGDDVFAGVHGLV